ncbi:MetQ/NlpA family ABC transporter substrate-binding protein [Devriesea agamarum]|uniref:MetQ/NlpA family ABC transporter substrate-binding protein n=1 Tax=Devriesea agamarum TaxID=472569 RepID=UPI00071C4010|nr:MetQ/NlpA family ABC transporter substrate-binding protein [Devriesea agamarum]
MNHPSNHNGPRVTRRYAFGAATGLAALALAACGSSKTSEGPKADGNGVTTLTIGATPVPQAQILEFVQKKLAGPAKLDLKIKVMDDYNIPNAALNDGEINANYFQHKPFLETQIKEKGYKLFPFEGIHIEPLGVYSKKLKALTLDQIPEGATFGITNDPTNQGRALTLLAKQKLFALKEGVEPTATTLFDIAENPKGIKFKEVDAAQLARSLGDFDAAVINGNFALASGLKPSSDALVLEDGKNNPYANMLVVREVDQDNPALVTLNKLLHSAEVKKYIQETWSDGAVIPAF